MVVFGCKNFLLDIGSFRMPSLIPLGYYTVVRADRRRADRAVPGRADRQRLEQRLRAARGRRRSRRRRMSNGVDPLPDGRAVPRARLLGVPVAFAIMAGVLVATALTPISLAVDGRPAVPRHRFRGAARGAVLPAGRRADDVGQRHPAHDRAGPDAGRPSARRARAGRDRCSDVLRRHLRLVDRRRRGAEPHRRRRRWTGRATTAPSPRR